jgi:LmbE family N-acetylglucosaminyl deacetylase
MAFCSEPHDGPVLMIGAHPDDIDFNAAGCSIALRDRGVTVVWCVVSDGQAGAAGDGGSREAAAALRRHEQLNSAAACGVDRVIFLGQPDGELTDNLALRRELTRVIRATAPRYVICHSPERDWERIYQCHPDHLAVGAATLAAVYPDARNPFAHPDLRAAGLEPHVVPETWLYGGPILDVFLDITEVAQRKYRALELHASQRAAVNGLIGAAQAHGAAMARRGGLAAGRVAEAFQRVDTR